LDHLNWISDFQRKLGAEVGAMANGSVGTLRYTNLDTFGNGRRVVAVFILFSKSLKLVKAPA
jgi:hypothetical protein